MTLGLPLHCHVLFLFAFLAQKKLLILSEQVAFLNYADRGHGSRFSTCAQDHRHLVFLGFTSNSSASESSLPTLPSLIALLDLHRRHTATQCMLPCYLSSPFSKQICAGFTASGSQTENVASSCCVLIAEKHSSHFFQSHYIFVHACVQNNASARLPGGDSRTCRRPLKTMGRKSRWHRVI